MKHSYRQGPWVVTATLDFNITWKLSKYHVYQINGIIIAEFTSTFESYGDDSTAVYVKYPDGTKYFTKDHSIMEIIDRLKNSSAL